METALPSFADGPGVDPRLAGGRLTIDLDALVENYRILQRLCAPATVAGVVKANAYGLGVEAVVPALLSAGCRRFFVALPSEGLAVRVLAPDADIFVLDGLFDEEAAPFYSPARLIPVLNTRRDVALWEAHCGSAGEPLACVVNVDTGMNRLGLTPDAAMSLARENALTGAIRPVLVMSHFACADDPMHPMNRRQIDLFQPVREAFGSIEASLANSSGVFLGPAAHFELARPGIALYGGDPVRGARNPMRTVVTAEARVLQLREAKAGETVGYGATETLARDTLIAVAGAGYADGYPRALSGGAPQAPDATARGGYGFIGGKRVKVLGRVSMDLTAFDVTDLGRAGVQPGDFIELFGPNIAIDDVARAAGTISYELLVSLGVRWHRHLVGVST